jgi:histidinol-phosphate/aromatic aminotransferase/cobyric acid decarboxylase-like protein
VNLLALEAARAAFRDTAYRKATLRHIAHERKLIQRAWRNAKRLKCYPTDSNAMLVKLPDDGEKVVPTLRKGGLEIRDCSDIEGLDKTFLRMSVASHEHNVKLMRLMAGFI